jgi:uncharacterized protein
MPHWLSITISAALILTGIVGTVVPIIPGLLVSWLGVLVYGLDRGFSVLGWIVLVIATALALFGTYLGFRIPQREAAGVGLDVPSQLFALAVAIVGAFVVPVVGMPLGFVVGVYLAQLRKVGNSDEALDATRVVVRGLVKSAGAQALCGLAMGGAWLVWVVVEVVG